ncbi:MAG TPA: hypothetical protein VFJ76_07705 [Solirubrobacterales bacterium]|nr:hypothetical protein [Solirubrobacterales bacterium]
MATATEYVKDMLGLTAKPVDEAVVKERLKRGGERLKEVTPRRKESIAFANNEHYVSLGKKGDLVRLDTVPIAQGGKKPDHRVRLSRDLIGPIVKAKRAALTQRIPGYESIQSSPDPEDYTAARLAEKVAVGGYPIWELKRHHSRWAWEAMVSEEGFIRPFWDSTVGPFVPDPKDPETYIGMGEVGVRVYGGTQVMWEPGIDFEDSRWIGIEEARPIEDVEAEPDYQGPKLNPDAATSDIPKERKGSKLVMVTEYLERPCAKWPEGRRLFFANGKVIFPEEPYPLKNVKDEIVDEPCLHRLTYDAEGSSDRGKGLVRSLIESMRQYDQGGNKALEWIQLILNPQWDAEEGTMKTPPTDEPGAVNEFAALAGGQPPKVREVPKIPSELWELQDRSKQEMDIISFSGELAMQKAESGKQAQAIAQQLGLSWQDFVEDFAEGAAKLMRDILTLVQIHYTEDRLVQFRGRTGWEQIADFKGADIRGQTDIRINPATLEPRTRQTNEQRIMNIANMFPGHFPPEVIISAMEGGSAEKLIEGYEDDVARANRIISLIRSGGIWAMPTRPVFDGEEGPKINPETGEVEMVATGQMEPILQGAGVPNPETGEEEQVQVGQRPQMQPVMETELPGWMPRPFDNIPVQKTVFTTWMKTDEWANLGEAQQRASMDIYGAMLRIEEREAQRQAQMQSEMAESAGMQNAAKPPPKPMPSLPALEQGE